MLKGRLIIGSIVFGLYGGISIVDLAMKGKAIWNVTGAILLVLWLAGWCIYLIKVAWNWKY